MSKRYAKKPNYRQKKTYTFEALSNIIYTYLREDGITLDLTGYTETVKAYRELIEQHVGESFELMIETLLWAKYFGELESFILYQKELHELDRDYLKATEILAEPSYDLEKQIQKKDMRMTHFKLYHKEVRNKRRFFEMAHHHCREIYGRGADEYYRIRN